MNLNLIVLLVVLFNCNKFRVKFAPCIILNKTIISRIDASKLIQLAQQFGCFSAVPRFLMDMTE